MAGKFHSEVLAIQKLRAKYPAMGQKTLARKIVGRSFDNAEDNATATNVGGREFFSTYSVIRRYDAKQKAAATVAA